MYYLQDVAAHELHGPFADVPSAHKYSVLRNINSYRIHTDMAAQNLHDPGSLRIVPKDLQGEWVKHG